MKKLYLVIAACAFSFGISAQSQATIQLTKGKAYTISNLITTQSTTNVMGQDMESNILSGTTYSMEVADASKAGYTLKNTIKSINMKMEMMGQEMKYDSNDPADANSPMAAGVSEYIGKPIVLNVDASGKILKVSTDANSGSALSEQLSKSGFGTQVAFLALPADVKVGDKWSVNDPDTSAISNKIDYVVKSIDGNKVTLDFSGTTKAKGTIENNGMEIHTNTTGTITGTAIVDKLTGITLSSKSTSKATGSVEVQGQEFPTQATVESTTTTTEAK